jgi:hypothetical protein
MNRRFRELEGRYSGKNETVSQVDLQLPLLHRDQSLSVNGASRHVDTFRIRSAKRIASIDDDLDGFRIQLEQSIPSDLLCIL